jgi:predicted nucleotidyltransferase
MDLARPFSVVTPTVDGDVHQELASADASFTPPQIQALAARHSVSGVRKALARLTLAGIVSAERIGQAVRYGLNREHLAAPQIIALAHLRSELIERMTDLLGRWSVAALYSALFGSATTGHMRLDSDIDIFVVRSDSVELDDDVWRAQLDDFARRVTAWTGNDTRILEFSAAEAHAALVGGSEPVLDDIREHGIRLHGRSTYLRSGRAPAAKS